MPRIPTSLLRRANRISPLLPPLIKTTRNLADAQIELRWLRAHALTTPNPALTLTTSIHRRSRLCEPLQYILGTQPFGATEILCRRNVLIPRAETEESASHLAELLRKNLPKGTPAKLVDLCTGTGCIPLLVAAELPTLALGVDISHYALQLAVENQHHNTKVLKEGSRVEFIECNVLQARDELLYTVQACFDELDPRHSEQGTVDVVFSNPPYISSRGYATETSRSVRNWEPRLALEAANQGDVFYPHIGEVAWELGARGVVTEVGGWEQAERVRKAWEGIGWAGSTVWEDFAGKGRTVVAWRAGNEWLKEGPNP